MSDSSWMADIVGKYKTTPQAVRQTATSWQSILKPNPKRWYVRFVWTQPGVGTCHVSPGPPVGTTGSFSGVSVPFESKFKDDPSGTTGEWFMFAAPGVDLLIFETEYIGG